MPNASPPAGSSPRLPRPSRVPPLALTAVVAALGGAGQPVELSGDPRTEVRGITGISSAVEPGDLFAAVPGARHHGARYADEAVAGGAVAVLTDPAGRDLLHAHVPVAVVPDVRAARGPPPAAVYDQPSRALDVLGVTGTSGKTTTAFLLRAGLRAGGRSPGLIGTVATVVGDELSDTVASPFTTPEAPELQAVLALMRERGRDSVAMEVSSHALALGRADGIGFAVAGFTNLSQDHLDFHPDMESYFAAKARLFDGRARHAVVMVDDDWGRRLAAQLGPAAVTASATGQDAAWRAVEVSAQPDGTHTFRALGPGVDVPAGTAVPGAYNVANALLALAMLDAAGVPAPTAASAVAAAVVPGRMERVVAGQPFLAVVDYAHKPAAVAGALAALRPLTAGRLIIALGCGGDRDRAKRPMMGELAARGSDLLIVTDDNPRSEDPGTIRAAMRAGAEAVPPGERGEIVEIGDRAEAIAAAVAAAGPGDTVLIAGKGHEPGQEINGVKYPFDDRAVLRAALEQERR